MRIADKSRHPRELDLTALIDVVMLVLIFFIVAGTIRPFSAKDFELAKISKPQSGASPRALIVVDRDGAIRVGNQLVELDTVGPRVSEIMTQTKADRLVIVADARLSAVRLMDVAKRLKDSGTKNISILTERLGKQ